MTKNYLLVLNETDNNRCNCVKWVRDRIPQLPFNLWTINEKKKIINCKKPKKGRVAIIKTGLLWGHVAIVKDVQDDKITIQEANFKICKITERKGTEKELKILGYFQKPKKKNT